MDECWQSEFAGFFWGEGNFMIDIWEKPMRSKRRLADGTIKDYGMRTQRMVRVRARIIQRDDNRAVLEYLCAQLGGFLYVHKSRRMVSGGNGKTYLNATQLVWQIQDRRQVEHVLDILESAKFPHTKAREIPIMREAIRIIDTHARGWADDSLEHLRTLKQLLTDNRTYVP